MESEIADWKNEVMKATLVFDTIVVQMHACGTNDCSLTLQLSDEGLKVSVDSGCLSVMRLNNVWFQCSKIRALLLYLYGFLPPISNDEPDEELVVTKKRGRQTKPQTKPKPRMSVSFKNTPIEWMDFTPVHLNAVEAFL